VHPLSVAPGFGTEPSLKSQRCVSAPSRTRGRRKSPGFTRGDHGRPELHGDRHYECVHGVRRIKLRPLQQRSRTSSARGRQVDHSDAASLQHPLDIRISSGPSADLCKHRRRHANQRLLLVRHLQYGPGTDCQRAPRGCVSQRVDCLGVQNQRLGHARLAEARALNCTGPSSASSSARNSPVALVALRGARARATKPDSPRVPTRLRTVLARSAGTLTDSFAALCGIRNSYHSRIHAATELRDDS